MAGGENFAEGLWLALRGDSPENVREVFNAEPVGGGEPFKVGVDRDLALVALDGGRALGVGQKRCAVEADFGRAAAVKVVDGREVTADNLDLVDRHAIAHRGWTLTLREAVGCGRVHHLSMGRKRG
jgi:hypothetical protein